MNLKPNALVVIGTIVICLLAIVAIAESPDHGPKDLFFPPVDGRDWAAVDPADAGWRPEGLEAVFEYAEARQSTGVVMLWHGYLLAERYWTPSRELVSSQPDLVKQLTYYGTTAEGWPREDVASTQKSVISFLVGVAASKGLVDIEIPVSVYLGEGWSKASPVQEARITVRHLLSMASGLDEQLAYEEPAGSWWRYNTPAYSRLGPVLEKASGHDLNALTGAWLTEPVGMTESGWRERPRELIPPHANPYGFVTTPRDLARFGLLMLNRGTWNGTTVLGEPRWIESSFSPSQKANPAYGYLWWLNGSDSLRRGRGRTEPEAGPLIPGAPADLVAAMGALDRRLYIVPSMSLIITRLGGPAGQGFDRELWDRLMKAVPEFP